MLYSYVPKVVFRLEKMRVSYAQDGEDLLASRILANSPGFYLDIGSGHPIFTSNTYLFYKLGWSGIAVDPNSALVDEWKKHRTRDTFINRAFSTSNQDIEYFIHPDLPTLNSTTRMPIQSRGYEAKINEIYTVKSPTVSAGYIESLPKRFELLSIDTEGNELEVLQDLFENAISFDLAIVEINNLSLTKDLYNHPTVRLCNENRMKLICKTLHNAFFLNYEASFAGSLPSRMMM